jgi:hypothetical protein
MAQNREIFSVKNGVFSFDFEDSGEKMDTSNQDTFMGS